MHVCAIKQKFYEIEPDMNGIFAFICVRRLSRIFSVVLLHFAGVRVHCFSVRRCTKRIKINKYFCLVFKFSDFIVTYCYLFVSTIFVFYFDNLMCCVSIA